MCMATHVWELVGNYRANVGEGQGPQGQADPDTRLQYLVIDCRSAQEVRRGAGCLTSIPDAPPPGRRSVVVTAWTPAPCAQFEAGHLPVAYHLDPQLLGSPEELHAVLESFKAMRGCHFAIMGSGDVAYSCVRRPCAAHVPSVRLGTAAALPTRRSAHTLLLLLCRYSKEEDGAGGAAAAAAGAAADAGTSGGGASVPAVRKTGDAGATGATTAAATAGAGAGAGGSSGGAGAGAPAVDDGAGSRAWGAMASVLSMAYVCIAPRRSTMPPHTANKQLRWHTPVPSPSSTPRAPRCPDLRYGARGDDGATAQAEAEASPETMLALLLLQKGFQHTSVVLGGYAGVWPWPPLCAPSPSYPPPPPSLHGSAHRATSLPPAVRRRP